MSNLTRAEKNAIIVNDAKGIQHPEYYVCHTKSGGIQVRKRKTPLTVTQVKPSEEKVQPDTVSNKATDSVPNKAMDSVPSKATDYETTTNKQLLEKMLAILEKNSESKDKNLNDPEREKETKENKEFIEGLREEITEPTVTNKAPTTAVHVPPKPRQRKGRNLLH